jgi:hypothetical protein
MNLPDPPMLTALATLVSAVTGLPDLLRALELVNWRQQNTGKDGFQ